MNGMTSGNSTAVKTLGLTSLEVITLLKRTKKNQMPISNPCWKDCMNKTKPQTKFINIIKKILGEVAYDDQGFLKHMGQETF